MLVIEGYGLTETSSSTTVNDPDDFRFGTVGRAVDGCEIRIDTDGEILVRAETVFAGYYKEPEATAAALHGGRLVPHRRRRRDRRGRLRQDHRPQEGSDHHGGRQEHRAAEPRERAQGVAVRLTGDRRRRPPPVRDRPDHARPGRGRRDRPRPAGAGAGARRRREPRPRPGRADQALHRAPARLLAGGGRDDADPEAPPRASSTTTSRTRSSGSTAEPLRGSAVRTGTPPSPGRPQAASKPEPTTASG